MVPLVVGAGLGVAGSVANYMGGRSEARRKQRALDEYNRTSADLYDQMAKDAWAMGGERQKATGDVIKGLIPTMSQGPSVAPDVASFLPEGPNGGFNGDEFRQWMASAGQPQQEVTQAQADATQAGLDRTALMRALDALGFSSGVTAQTQAPAHQRFQWQKQQELEEARRRLEAVLGSTGNSARNLQLLGSLLGTGAQASMMYGAMGGAGPTATPPMAPGAGVMANGLPPSASYIPAANASLLPWR